MNIIEQLTAHAKNTIKDRFDKEIELYFATKENFANLKQELEKRYEVKLDGLSGAFRPLEGVLDGFILVSYAVDDTANLLEIFHHEFQHAIDYFEIMKKIGNQPKYFKYYTEYNATYSGFMACCNYDLSEMSFMDKTDHIKNAKKYLRDTFIKQNNCELCNLLCYCARVTVFCELEEEIDYSLLNFLPKCNQIVSLLNWINRYEPTEDWYAEFSNQIEKLMVK